MSHFFRASIAFALVASAVSCGTESTPATTRVNAVDLVFLTQSEPQRAYMDALFTGRVIIDASRCTRLGDADGATVIWPAGFTVAQEGSSIRVLDNTGRAVGRLGESFRIGGGEVSELHHSLQISYMDRAMAHESCPGRYWIAAPIQ